MVFFLWGFQMLNAQNLTLEISVKSNIENAVIENLNFQKKHLAVKSIFSQIDSLQLKFERLGFFDNKLDSLVKIDSVYTAYFSLGKSTERIRIFYDKNNITKKNISQHVKNVNDQYFEITVEEVTPILNKLLQQFNQQGKSFTTLSLKEIRFYDNHLSATLDINTSKIRVIDKVIINGYKNFPKTFLKHFLQITPNTVFSTQKINSISKQIQALPFVSESKLSEVLFTKDSTYLYLYLKKEKANRFDGLVGFTSNETNNKLVFNGYLDLDLNNVLNGGENIQLNWKNNGNDRQLFNFGIELPYIFNSLLTPKLHLNIYRQDSTFINTNFNVGVNYRLNSRSKIGLILNTRNSNNLLDNPVTDIVSFNTVKYGASYDYKVLSNSFLHPVKFNISTSILFGNRKSQNTSVDQFQFNVLTNYLWSLNYRNHLFIQNETAFLNSDNYLTNELFRIGGVNSIRGFNEESIFASLYSVVNLEYRYNPNNSSHLYSITDAAFVRNQLTNLSEQIFSLGLGYRFNTSFGFLDLSYAIGKFGEQDFDFNNSRFHLKITNSF